MPRERKWPPEKVDAAFDKLNRKTQKKYGRPPKQDEFVARYPGAMSAIAVGNYHRDIRTWKKYLKHRFDGKIEL